MKRVNYKEQLIFIAGSTPQVITETICALASETPPIYPDALHILTTEIGKKTASEALLEKGILKELFREYDIPPVSLLDGSFIVPHGDSGKPLTDIRNEDDNERMGDAITSFVREMARNPANRLHCSIAGGRKTMSFYLGAAMQLFGRPWDKLYHVLVTPEFESNPGFFYKPRKDRVIKVDGRQLNTRNAEVTLAELPFIRLRNKLQLEPAAGFRELVEEGQKEIDIAIIQPELRVNLAAKTVTIGEKKIKFSPIHLMIYTAYLRQKVNRCRYPDRPYCLDCTECFPALLELATKPALEEMAKDYILMHPSRTDDLLYKYKSGLPVDVIRQAISKIRRAIKDEIAEESLASLCAITTSLRGYSNTRHGVRAEKGRIRIQ